MSVVNELFEPFDRLSFLFQIQIPAEKKHHWDARAAEGVETAEEEEGGEEVLQDGLGGDAAQEEEKEEDNQPVQQLTCFIPTDPCCSSSLWKNIIFITWLGDFCLILFDSYAIFKESIDRLIVLKYCEACAHVYLILLQNFSKDKCFCLHLN